MTRIKICGITNADDARAAVRLGADALGFIAVPDTPRYVTVEAARALLHGLPPLVTPVVVVRNLSGAISYTALAHAVQYYRFDEAHPSLHIRVPAARIPAVRVRADEPLWQSLIFDEYRTTRPLAVLLDAFHETALGGAGVSWDWSRAEEAKRLLDDVPLILAGGLTPENVGDAIRQVRPYAVDVSSGVEASPGRKDHDKLRAFIKAVRDADTALENDDRRTTR